MANLIFFKVVFKKSFHPYTVNSECHSRLSSFSLQGSYLKKRHGIFRVRGLQRSYNMFPTFFLPINWDWWKGVNSGLLFLVVVVFFNSQTLSLMNPYDSGGKKWKERKMAAVVPGVSCNHLLVQNLPVVSFLFTWKWGPVPCVAFFAPLSSLNSDNKFRIIFTLQSSHSF